MLGQSLGLQCTWLDMAGLCVDVDMLLVVHPASRELWQHQQTSCAEPQAYSKHHFVSSGGKAVFAVCLGLSTKNV